LDRDPSNEDSLIEAKIDRAFSAIILGSDKAKKDPQDVDARSILIALAVEICNPKVHSVVELQNSENKHHAKNAGVDEIIVASTYQGSILAQSAASPGVSVVFSEIFGLTTTSIYQEPITEILFGKKYTEVVQWYTNENIGAILGIIRDGSPILVPKPSLELKEHDKLVVLRKSDS
jgi:Trk K+ transport system NAD-binding subunit